LFRPLQLNLFVTRSFLPIFNSNFTFISNSIPIPSSLFIFRLLRQQRLGRLSPIIRILRIAPHRRLLIKIRRRQTKHQTPDPKRARVLVPQHDIDRNRQDLAHVPHHRETRRRQERSRQPREVGHAHSQGHGEEDGHAGREGNGSQGFDFVGVIDVSEYQRQTGQEIGIKDSSPIALHLDRIRDVLQINLIHTENDVPNGAEGVSPDVKRRIRHGISRGAHQEGKETRPAPRTGKPPSQKQVIRDAHHQGSRKPKDHEGLDVGILQTLHVAKNGRQENQRHGQELETLFLFQRVALDFPQEGEELDDEGGAHELGEEDEGRGGDFVDGVFVGDEEGGAAEHVAGYGEGGGGEEGLVAGGRGGVGGG